MIRKMTFILLGALLLLGSCYKDKQKLAQKAIIGKWNIDKQIINGKEETDVGSIKFYKKESSITSDYNTEDILEVTISLNGEPEYTIGYEFFQGRKKMILNYYNADGSRLDTFIEMMTKKIFIYQDINGSKFYLSK